MKNTKLIIYFFLVTIAFIQCKPNEVAQVDLSGEWTIKLDPENDGIDKEWFTKKFAETIKLPGCLQAQGYGEKPGPNTKWWAPLDLSKRHPSLEKYSKADDNFKLVQYLMPRKHFIGAAWYAREIEIPEAFKGKQIILNLERCHWESQVWLDGEKLGSNQSLATPHIYNLSQFAPGKHQLSIRIDNGKIVDLGQMPHSVSDQTQGTWNGIVGEIALFASDAVFIQNVKLYPNIENKSVKGLIEVSNSQQLKERFEISLDALGFNNGNKHDPKGLRQTFQLNGEKLQTLELTYVLGEETKLWDEFDPNLYHMKVELEGAGFEDEYSTTFGMRKMTTDGKFFYVNGSKTYLRGNVDCAVNPRTGYAPMSLERWKEIFQQYKNFGLNHVRFHSWCPPEQAFVAADEMGLYLAPEVHEWSWVRKGKTEAFLKEESAKMLREYANHPSFVMMGLGNESGIDMAVAQDLLNEWKEYDSSRLYTIKASDASHQGFPANMDYEILGHVRDEQLEKGRVRTRYQAFWPPLPENSAFYTQAPQTTIDWSEGLSLYANKYGDRPLIAHETAQFCAYPDVFNELKKYTGYLRPTYLEIAADQLEERGMTEQLPDFVKNSGKWQVLLSREEVEASLRTPDLAGFQWLALNDFTGQNTAPVGFTDAFYEAKSYVNGDDMKRFCAPTVLLARLQKRVFTAGQIFSADFEVSHFAKNMLNLDDFTATVFNESGIVIKEEIISAGEYSQGNVQNIGSLKMALNDLPAPAKYNLNITSIKNKLLNNYDFWVYPESKTSAIPTDIVVTNKWDKNTLADLEAGETVLLLPKIGSLKGNLPACFTTFYWTSFGEQGGQSSACGITLDNDHPLFANFPTESHANWQWWDLLTQCQPMILDQFEEQNPWPKSYGPLVQPIDSWKLNRKLALVVEAKVGKGKLIICSMDIETNLEHRPVAKQFRKSVFDYMVSLNFNPATEVKPEVISALFDKSKPEKRMNLQGLPTEG